MSPRIAIVTGGSRGIGRAVVERLHRGGTQVATCGRGSRPDHLPDDVLWAQADVSDPADTRDLVTRAEQLWGPVGLLVNNAGTQIEKTLPDTTDDDWDLVVGTNCRGAFNMCRAVLPSMIIHGGVIINVGSVSGLVADPTMAVYNASKAFVHALTRSVAVDHGPAVRCNAVLPGWIQTGMAEDAFAIARDPIAARRDATARHPAGRLGEPSDIAATVAWLASDEAAFITGQCFRVDGGMTAASPLRPELF